MISAGEPRSGQQAGEQGTKRRPRHPLIDEWEMSMRARGLADRTVVERCRVIAWLERELNTGATDFTTEQLTSILARDYAATTRFNYHVVMRTWAGWLVQTGRRSDDPTADLGTPRLPRMRPRPARTAHIDAVLTDDGVRRRTVLKVLLAARQGLRVHEVAKLRGEDIDRIGRTLRVAGKGGYVAELVLDPYVAELLEEFPRRGWIFPSPVHPTKHVSAQAVSKVLCHAFRRVGANVTAHQLRHWLATELIRRGVPTRVVQDVMRHASLATTEGYTAVVDDQRRSALDLLPPPAGSEAYADRVDY